MVFFPLPVQKSYKVFSLSSVKILFVWSNQNKPKRFSLQRTLSSLDVWAIFLLILFKKAIEPSAHESVPSPWRDTIKPPYFLSQRWPRPLASTQAQLRRQCLFNQHFLCHSSGWLCPPYRVKEKPTAPSPPWSPFNCEFTFANQLSPFSRGKGGGGRGNKPIKQVLTRGINADEQRIRMFFFKRVAAQMCWSPW